MTTDMETVRVVLVEDEPLYRDLLRIALISLVAARVYQILHARERFRRSARLRGSAVKGLLLVPASPAAETLDLAADGST